MILDQWGREVPRGRLGFVKVPASPNHKSKVEGGDCHAVGFEQNHSNEWRGDEELCRDEHTEGRKP